MKIPKKIKKKIIKRIQHQKGKVKYNFAKKQGKILRYLCVGDSSQAIFGFGN